MHEELAAQWMPSQKNGASSTILSIQDSIRVSLSQLIIFRTNPVQPVPVLHLQVVFRPCLEALLHVMGAIAMCLRLATTAADSPSWFQPAIENQQKLPKPAISTAKS